MKKWWEFGKRDGRIFYIQHKDDGSVEIGESCDLYFTMNFTKDEAIAALQECIDFINLQESDNV